MCDKKKENKKTKLKPKPNLTIILQKKIDMSSVEISKMSESEKKAYVYSYATLLLADSKAPISEENLKKVIEAAGNKTDKVWTDLIAKSFKDKDVNSLFSVGSSQPAAP